MTTKCGIQTVGAKLAPSELFLGNRQISCIHTVADDNDSLHETYWLFSNALSGISYYVWQNSGGGTDPSLAGRVGIEVDFDTNDDAIAMAEANVVAINSVANRTFTAKRTGNAIRLYMHAPGAAEPATDGPGGAATEFEFESLKEGSLLNLGRTQEGVNIEVEFSSVEVTSDQTGEQIQDLITSGANATISTSLIELTDELYEQVLAKSYGDSLEINGTTVTGVGTSKLFKNASEFAQELIVRPFNAPDERDTFTFFSVVVTPNSITRSGTDVEAMEVEIRAFRSPFIREEISLFARGDIAGDIFV